MLRTTKLFAVALLLFFGCDVPLPGPSRELPDTATTRLALDDMEEAPEGVSLGVLSPDADWKAIASAIEEMGGSVYHILPPRLIVSKLTRGQDAVLHQLGLQSLYDRAAYPDEIPNASRAEQRFVDVFSNRYFADEVEESRRLVLLRSPEEDGEKWETDAPLNPEIHNDDSEKLGFKNTRSALSQDDQMARESRLFVPYASGIVVAAVWLPESNGTNEPSTEDWSEKQILEVYTKIQAALEAIKRHEPNSKLQFILHYESSPGPGALTGTIDHDFEFGKHASFDTGNTGNGENRSKAAILGRLLGREVPENEVPEANREYLNALRKQYNADGAFYIAVAANGNGTAGQRAHAYRNGPSATLDSRDSWRTFMHEFGHIFGAADEYCPDACQSPTGLAGYLGVINANAVYHRGSHGGINQGQGEMQESLMMYNRVNAVNGYTRGAWGWLDTDGDGLIDVRDTFPKSDLSATSNRNGIILAGTITDVPAPRGYAGDTGFSVNRIEYLEYRFPEIPSCPWFKLPVSGQTRGREYVNLNLGHLPFGGRPVEIRATNSVGNKEPTPKIVNAVGDRANTAPHIRLSTRSRIASTSAEIEIRAEIVDLEDDLLRVQFDADGDGYYEVTGSTESVQTVIAYFGEPGIYTVSVMAEDEEGNEKTETIELYVLAGNSAPFASMNRAPSPISSGDTADVVFRAQDSFDAENDSFVCNWIVEKTGIIGNEQKVETGFGHCSEFVATLKTPLKLGHESLDLMGALEGPIYDTYDEEIIDDNIVALALGQHGIAIVDFSNEEKPVLLSQLSLETAVHDILYHENRLYALGGQLSLVDVEDLSNPVEIKQSHVTTAKIHFTNEAPTPIDALGRPALHEYRSSHMARIQEIEIAVVIDHPNPEHLVVSLIPNKKLGLKPIVLHDMQPGSPYGDLYVFTEQNTPKLALLRGKFSDGFWTVDVRDMAGVVSSGDSNSFPPEKSEAGLEKPSEFVPVDDLSTSAKQTGTLLESHIFFRTAHRAVNVLESPEKVVGVIPESFSSSYVLVAGRGLQGIWISEWMPEYTSATWSFNWDFRGERIFAAEMVGDRLIAATTPETLDDAETSFHNSYVSGETFGTDLRGLLAFDLSWPSFPELVRMEKPENGSVVDLGAVGNRFYVKWQLPSKKTITTAGSLPAFLSGHDSYIFGAGDVSIGRFAFGDDSTLYTLNNSGRIDKVDVSYPSSIRLSESYTKPHGSRMTYLGNNEALVAGYPTYSIAHLEDTISTTSRVYQVTLETKDSNQSASKAVRNIHIIPYTHPPSIADISIEKGLSSADTWSFEIDVEDPDDAPPWDPHIMAMVDVDGDGIWDTNWVSGWAAGGRILVDVRFPNPGTYKMRFMVRDGFYGLSRVETLDVDVPPPSYCDDNQDCAENEFCHFETSFSSPKQICGNGYEGMCSPLPQECEGIPMYRATDPFSNPEEVCGCDGNDYPSECDANQAGVSIMKYEACDVESD